MATRERFFRVFHGQTPDRAPNMEFGTWDVTMRIWKGQGLPACPEGVSIFPRVSLKNDLNYLDGKKEILQPGRPGLP